MKETTKKYIVYFNEYTNYYMFCKVLMFRVGDLKGIKPILYTDSHEIATKVRSYLNKTLKD